MGVASFKEELKIENTDIVTDILKVNTEIQNKEVKISHNKVLAKADLEVSVSYLTQDERVCEAREKFPIMSFIDIENVNDNDTCTTDYQVRSILVTPNNGEENSITLQMDYEIVCKAFEYKEQTVVSDLYSLKYDLELNTAEIEIGDDNRIVRVVQNVTKKENLPEETFSMVVYSIKKEDTLWNVSKKFRVKQENIIKSNNLEEPYDLKAGEKLYILR